MQLQVQLQAQPKAQLQDRTASRSAVVVRAGKNSTHAGWVLGAVPEFDLIVAAYEPLPEALREAAHHLIPVPGYKVAGWSALFMRQPDLLDRYDHIALIDDDIVCNAQDINRCFAIGRDHRLSLWQPSLAWRSHCTYGVVLHNPNFILRYTNFVEMMCPFFTSGHLRAALPLFSRGYETGIDQAWCRLPRHWRESFAVIDAVQVVHSQPVGGKKSDQGFTTDYRVVVNEVDDFFGLNFRGPVAYAGIGKNGSRVQGRWPMALHALAPLRGVAQAPDRQWFRKSLTDHIRHNLTRPIGIDVPTSRRPVRAPCSQILVDAQED